MMPGPLGQEFSFFSKKFTTKGLTKLKNKIFERRRYHPSTDSKHYDRSHNPFLFRTDGLHSLSGLSAGRPVKKT